MIIATGSGSRTRRLKRCWLRNTGALLRRVNPPPRGALARREPWRRLLLVTGSSHLRTITGIGNIGQRSTKAWTRILTHHTIGWIQSCQKTTPSRLFTNPTDEHFKCSCYEPNSSLEGTGKDCRKDSCCTGVAIIQCSCDYCVRLGSRRELQAYSYHHTWINNVNTYINKHKLSTISCSIQ